MGKKLWFVPLASFVEKMLLREFIIIREVNDGEFGYNGGLESFESGCDFGCLFEGKSRRIE